MLKTYWKPITGILIGLAILVAGTALWYQHRRPGPDTSYKLPAGPETKPQASQAPLKETPTVPAPEKQNTGGGHWHGDEWHAEPHSEGDPNTAPIPPVQYTAPPGAVTAPVFPEAAPNEDPVKAAYKRLEYIANNIYAWGGVFSPRATELIVQLMPPPALRDHAHGDEVELLIEELIEQGDPRAAKVLIANMCEGGIAGWPMFNAIVSIGPPAVPSALIYLNDPYLHAENVSIRTAVRLLGEIAEQHRGDLGGIVEHIILPKFTLIAADEKFEKFNPPTVEDAREFLVRLQ